MSSRLGLAAVGLLSIWTFVLLYVQFTPLQSLTSLSVSGGSQHEYKSVKPEVIRKNLWSDLTAVEAEGLRVWLHSPERGLGLTPSANATGMDDVSIQLFEILRPNKTDTIPFIDYEGVEPQRYARVTFLNGTVPGELSSIDEYMVGPIPITAETTIEPLTYIYNSNRSRTKSRLGSFVIFREWMKDLSEDIYDIAHDLFNFTIRADGTPTHMPGSVDPFWVEGDRDVAWLGFYQDSPARSILPQSLFFKADITGQNASEWRVLEWLYNDIKYENLDALKAAWKSSGFVKLPANTDGSWTELRPDSNPTADLPPPPKLHQSGPPRVFVDKEEKFVSWLNFTFTIGFSQITAMSLFDIRVDDERIFYELGFQEAMAHYAGDDPKMSGTSYLDSSFSFGALLAELAPGYDCPEYAEYLDTEFHRAEKSFPRRNTICVFEKPMDYPLQRHTDSRYTSSFSATTLVVRSIATIGNYDYLIDYIFYVDGSIEVKVRASGYIQGAYALHNQLYGYKVREALSTAMHDHVINFKADLDIGGYMSNTFQNVAITEKDITYPWAPNQPRRTMVLDAQNITSESSSSLNWPRNSGAMYLISSPERNQWGELRSYRMLPGTGIGTPPHLTMKDSSNLREASRWAEYDIFVTKQKDTEPSSCSPLNGYTPSDPLVRFADFLADNETLVDEDLVLWFNLGSHHIPHSGDIPNTVMTGSSSSVIFSPFNFWSRDRGMDWSKGITIDHPDGDGVRWIASDPEIEATGYFTEDNTEGIPQSEHEVEDLRARSKISDSQIRPRPIPGPGVKFFGPHRSPQELGEELEQIKGFKGLRLGAMKEYMPVFRDFEIF